MPLSRVLEPEVMDTLEEALDYDAMDHEEVNRQFVHDLLSTGDPLDEVLDLGAGTARIPIALCRACETCRIVAVDLAAAMLDTARNNVEIACLSDRILLRREDAKALPYDEGRFSAVISNSIIHHIPEPLAVLREAVRVAAPGARLFFRDLRRPDTQEELRRLVETYGGEEEHGRQMFAASLRAALTLDEIRSLIGELGYAADCVQQTSDRHWTWSASRNGL